MRGHHKVLPVIAEIGGSSSAAVFLGHRVFSLGSDEVNNELESVRNLSFNVVLLRSQDWSPPCYNPINHTHTEETMVHQIQFDVEAPSLNGEELGRLIEIYLAHQRKKSQATTVKGYRFKLRPFEEWWRDVGPARGWVLSSDDLFEYEQYLHELGWGYSSRFDALKRLRQVFKWAHQRGYLAIDFSLFVPKTQGGPPAKRPLSLEELNALLNACWRTSNPVRNRCIIAILAGTGLRREECAALQIEDVTVFDDGAGYLRPQVTKNDKPRLVAFDGPTGAYIRQWLEIIHYKAGPLFPSRKGGQALSPDGLYKVVLDTAELAGVDVETHDFRRMFATVWSRQLRGEAYGQLLQTQLGHANYATTAIYALQQVDDVLEALRQQPVSPIALLQAK